MNQLYGFVVFLEFVLHFLKLKGFYRSHLGAHLFCNHLDFVSRQTSLFACHWLTVSQSQLSKHWCFSESGTATLA